MMSFSEAIKSGFKKYTSWNGRAARSEYWFWLLFQFLILIGTQVLDLAVGTLIFFNAITSLALFLPTLAVTVRRFHDSGKSAAWLLVSFLPIILFLIIAVLVIINGTDTEIWSNSDTITVAILAIISLLVILAASIILFIFTVLPSSVETNKYGENPLTSAIDYFNQTPSESPDFNGS